MATFFRMLELKSVTAAVAWDSELIVCIALDHLPIGGTQTGLNCPKRIFALQHVHDWILGVYHGCPEKVKVSKAPDHNQTLTTLHQLRELMVVMLCFIGPSGEK